MRPYSANVARAYRWAARSLTNIPGRLLEAEKYYLRSLKMNEEGRQLYELSVNWNNLADYYRLCGNLEQALYWSDKEMSQVLLYPHDPQWAFSHYLRGSIMLMLGRIEEAASEAEEAMEISRRPNHDPNWVMTAHFLSVCTSLAQGDLPRAEQALASFAAVVAGLDEQDDAEWILLEKQARVAMAFFTGGPAPGAEEVLRAHREAGLFIEGCTNMGLSLLPAVYRGIKSDGLSQALDVLRSTAGEIQNTFWSNFGVR